MTILGWLAVGQIRRSAGKLRGLGLAVFDGLLFPLLALDFVIAGIAFSLLPNFRSEHLQWLEVAIVVGWVGLALAVDAWISWKVWRAVNTNAPPIQKADRFWRYFAIVIACAPLILVAIVIAYLVRSREDSSSDRFASVSRPEIQNVVVSKDDAVVRQRRYNGEGLLFMFGAMTNRWEPKHLDSLFAVTLEPRWLGHGASWVIRRAHGPMGYNLDTPAGTIRGRIVFDPGTPAPEADGSYVIGAFQPESGPRLPIGVKLVTVTVNLEKGAWQKGEPPKFEVLLKNSGKQSVAISGLASLALEVDGEIFPPFAWMARTLKPLAPLSPPIQLAPGNEYSFDISLNDFAEDEGSPQPNLQLTPGHHTVRLVVLNNTDAKARALEYQLHGYAETALGISNPIELEIPQSFKETTEPASRTFALRYGSASQMFWRLRREIFRESAGEAKPSADDKHVTVTAPLEVLNRAATFIVVEDWPLFANDPPEIETAKEFFKECARENVNQVSTMLSTDVLAELAGTNLLHSTGPAAAAADAQLTDRLHLNWPGSEAMIRKVIAAYTKYPLSRIRRADPGPEVSKAIARLPVIEFEGAPEEFGRMTYTTEKEYSSDKEYGLAINRLPPWFERK
jgi:hypothetical protein